MSGGYKKNYVTLGVMVCSMALACRVQGATATTCSPASWTPAAAAPPSLAPTATSSPWGVSRLVSSSDWSFLSVFWLVVFVCSLLHGSGQTDWVSEFSRLCEQAAQSCLPPILLVLSTFLIFLHAFAIGRFPVRFLWYCGLTDAYLDPFGRQFDLFSRLS